MENRNGSSSRTHTTVVKKYRRKTEPSGAGGNDQSSASPGGKTSSSRVSSSAPTSRLVTGVKRKTPTERSHERATWLCESSRTSRCESCFLDSTAKKRRKSFSSQAVRTQRAGERDMKRQWQEKKKKKKMLLNKKFERKKKIKEAKSKR